MAENESLSSLLEEANRRLLEEIDFSRTDSEATDAKVQFLTLAAEIIHEYLIQKFGGQRGTSRGRELIEQVIAAAFQSFGGEELYPDHFDRAATLWRGITGGHTFVDGNKRTGFVLTSYYLELVGYPPPPLYDREDVKKFGWSLADGEIRDVATISHALRTWWGANEGGQ